MDTDDFYQQIASFGLTEQNIGDWMSKTRSAYQKQTNCMFPLGILVDLSLFTLSVFSPL